jgi:hypothetical protein
MGCCAQADEQSYQIDFEDRLTNLRARPTGVFVHYALIAPQSFGPDTVTPGGAENPTMFLDAAKDILGMLVQDDVSRVRWGAKTAVANAAGGASQILSETKEQSLASTPNSRPSPKLLEIAANVATKTNP